MTRQPWSLTSEALERLLAAFDSDRERAGRHYERVRSGLLCFFEWRGAPYPDEHADDTLNRVARKLADGDRVDDPFTFVYGVARLVLLEAFKRHARERAALVQQPADAVTLRDSAAADDRQRRLDCLDRCLEQVPEEGRTLLTEYYHGEKRTKIAARARLAARLRIAPNALRLRAHRLRQGLASCVDQCTNRGRTAGVHTDMFSGARSDQGE